MNQSRRFHCIRLAAIALTFFALAITAIQPVSAFPIQDEDAAQQIFDRASLAQNNEEYDFALKQWEDLLAQHSTSVLASRASYNAGICTLQKTNYEKAIEYFGKALPNLDDESGLKSKAALFLGFAQYRHGRDLKADESKKQQATSLLTSSTQTFATLLNSGKTFDEIDQACFFQGGAFEELEQDENALKSYTQMLTYPKQTYQFEGLLAIGDVEARLGHAAEALKHYEAFRTQAASVGGHPMLDVVNLETGRTLIRIGIADEKAGNKQNADQNFNKAITILKPIADRDSASNKTDDAKLRSGEARFQQAYCLERLGQHAQAATAYQSIADDPNSRLATQSLAYAGSNYLSAGETDKARAALEKAIAVDSKYGPDAAHTLVEEIYLKSNPAQSQKAYDTATAWIAKSAESSALVSLKLDQANAIYSIPDRRKESVAMFQTIVDQHSNHPLAPQALYNSAFAAIKVDDFKSAIDKSNAFENTYAESDFLPDTLEIKADAAMLSSQPEIAAQVFDQLAAKFPENKKNSVWKLGAGRAMYLQKKFQPTIDRLTPLVNQLTDPNAKAEALHWIGSSQYQNKDYVNAVNSLTRSHQLNGKWLRADETLFALCRSQMASEQIDQGKATGDKLISEFPKSPLLSDLYYHLGRHAYDAEQYEEALTNFNQINLNYSDSRLAPYALYDAAWSQMELKKFAESEKLFATLISKFPEHELAKKSKVGRGASLRKTGDTAASIKELKEFLKTADPSGKARSDALFEIGLNQVELEKWDDAVGTFKMLITESGTSPKLDRFYYELAWAYRSKGEEKTALEYFTKITTEKPESPLAGESNFHVGTAAYKANDFENAIKAYDACVQSNAESHVREKAVYKLAWAHYKQKQFEPALKNFQAQVKEFPKGDLNADGLFMVAESQFRLKRHKEALEAYLAAKPIVDMSESIEPKIKWLTMLHGSQSANNINVGRFDDAIMLASGMEASQADLTFKQDAALEMGSAYAGKNQNEQALKYYRIASKNLGRTGARARCMIGDMYFASKKFEEAGDEFKLVYFGFGGPDAAPDVKEWQAYAIYESARCSFVQVENADAGVKQKLIAESIRQFEYLLNNYPNDRLADEAKRQLDTLNKLKK